MERKMSIGNRILKSKERNLEEKGKRGKNLVKCGKERDGREREKNALKE